MVNAEWIEFLQEKNGIFLLAASMKKDYSEKKSFKQMVVICNINK